MTDRWQTHQWMINLIITGLRLWYIFLVYIEITRQLEGCDNCVTFVYLILRKITYPSICCVFYIQWCHAVLHCVTHFVQCIRNVIQRVTLCDLMWQTNDKNINDLSLMNHILMTEIPKIDRQWLHTNAGDTNVWDSNDKYQWPMILKMKISMIKILKYVDVMKLTYCYHT